VTDSQPLAAPTGRLMVVGSGVVGTRVGRLAGNEAQLMDRASQLPADLDAGDVVVLATGGPHGATAAALCARGISVVSVADDLGDVRELLDLDDAVRAQGATLVVGAAMSPGLSGLLVRHVSVALAQVDEIHIAFHATAGPGCARQHHRALAGTSIAWHDGAWVTRSAGSGRELCWFPEPVGAHDCYRAELSDPLVLQRDFPTATRISARVSATRRDRLTARLPMLRPPHPEGGVGALRVEVRGPDAAGARVSSVVGIAEFVGAATAATALSCAREVLASRAPTGVVTTADPRWSAVVLAGVVRSGIRLQEFTGVATQR